MAASRTVCCVPVTTKDSATRALVIQVSSSGELISSILARWPARLPH